MEDKNQSSTSIKHATIMFTGIAGFHRLMGSDEKLALDVRQKNKEIHTSILTKYQGSQIKETNDGILASFYSVTEAMRCARDLQDQCSIQGIPLKVGVHSGQVVFAEEDVLGDSVNVAARLLQNSKEGQILISEIVCSEIKDSDNIKTQFSGEWKLKNVKEKLKVYEVLHDAKLTTPIPWLKKKKRSNLKLVAFLLSALMIISIVFLIWKFSPILDKETKIKSIAVRPFWNESADADNVYFVNGITEEIRNKLSKIADLRIISRGSMEKYRETQLSTIDIADELYVNYILEGTVQKQGEHVKMQVQLIEAETGDYIWEDRYESDISDVNDMFDVQNQIAESVARKLEAMVLPQEQQIMEKKLTENPEAYELYLRARDYHMLGDSLRLSIAIHLYNQAIDLDPQFAQVYVWLGLAYFNQTECKDCPVDTLRYFARRALSINQDLPDAYWMTAHSYFQISEFDSSIHHSIKAIELDPNHSMALRTLGMNYYAKRDYFNALIYLGKARKLLIGEIEPYKDILDKYAIVYMSFGNFEKTDSILNELMNYDPSSASYWKTLLYLIKGNFDQAKIYLDNYCAEYRSPACFWARGWYYAMVEDFEKFNETVENQSRLNFLDINWKGFVLLNLDRKEEAIENCHMAIASLEKDIEQNRISASSGPIRYELAAQYALLGDKEKAYQILNEAVELTAIEGWQVWVMHFDPRFKDMNQEEEFQGIIERLDTHYANISAELASMEAAGML
jgi:TolB-like protein/class 3 adenylate cyclase/Tfp pilus assembly protein PilF